MTVQDQASSSMNDAGTNGKIDTPLTQACSLDVRTTRESLIAMRVKHGADTPIGHRCSNLIGQLENYEHVMGADRKRAVDRLIMRSVAELATLTRDPQ